MVPLRLGIISRPAVSVMNIQIVQEREERMLPVLFHPAQSFAIHFIGPLANAKNSAVITRTLGVVVQPGTEAQFTKEPRELALLAAVHIEPAKFAAELCADK